MKKFLKTILVAIFAITLLCTSLLGCGEIKWKGNGLTDSGSATSVGGFIAETEKYYYFINGLGISTDDNTMGVPEKGALYAADKTDLSKISLVVPKLFVASDYNAGVYIYNDYVYYGTPSTYTNSSGSTANDELMFMKTKLDGTVSYELFNAGALSTQYRILEKDGDVYIVYYDSAKSALISYNDTTKESTTIVNKDVKNDEILGDYKFVQNEYTGEGVVIYTTNVYLDKYDEERANAQGANYARTMENFNKVYLYKIGDAVDETHKDALGTKILDGNATSISLNYTLKLTEKEYVFYTSSDVTGVELTKVMNFTNGNKADVISSAYVKDDSLYSITEDGGNISASAYAVEDEKIKKIDLLSSVANSQEVLAKVITASKLLLINGDFIYYYTTNGELARIKIYNVRETVGGSITQEMVDEDKSEQLISEGTVNTSWYKPEIIKENNLDSYICFCDSSDYGASYIRAISINSPVLSKDTDEDGNVDKWYLDGEFLLLGKMADAAIVQVVEHKITNIEELLKDGELVFDAKDSNNKDAMQAVLDAKEAYDNLTSALKSKVASEKVETLNKYIEATRIYNIIAPLTGFEEVKYYALSETEQAYYLEIYHNAKEALEGLKKSNTYDYDEVTELFMGNGCGYGYQCAKEVFE